MSDVETVRGPLGCIVGSSVTMFVGIAVGVNVGLMDEGEFVDKLVISSIAEGELATAILSFCRSAI